jgi:hypothetical protein
MGFSGELQRIQFRISSDLIIFSPRDTARCGIPSGLHFAALGALFSPKIHCHRQLSVVSPAECHGFWKHRLHFLKVPGSLGKRISAIRLLRRTQSGATGTLYFHLISRHFHEHVLFPSVLTMYDSAQHSQYLSADEGRMHF